MIDINLFWRDLAPVNEHGVNVSSENIYNPPKNVYFHNSLHEGILSEFDGISLFVDDDMFSPLVDKVKSKVKVGWLLEPSVIKPNNYMRIHDVVHKFDYILTHDADLHKLNPKKYKLGLGAGCWIKPQDRMIWPKLNLGSFVISRKAWAPGHKLRFDIFDTVFSKQFHMFGGAVNPFEDKDRLSVYAPYHFSIQVENCRKDNYFNEKVLDCFATGTIPIYWGCPNIGEYFDPRGIIAFETKEELAEILDGLTEKDYYDRMDAVKANLDRVEKYVSTTDYHYELYWKRNSRERLSL